MMNPLGLAYKQSTPHILEKYGMKGSHILNYQELPRLRGSISYLYVEHAVIEKDDNAIVSISAEGRMPISVSGVTCLLLGPGANVTHS